jgi:hypothetical protein
LRTAEAYVKRHGDLEVEYVPFTELPGQLDEWREGVTSAR